MASAFSDNPERCCPNATNSAKCDFKDELLCKLNMNKKLWRRLSRKALRYKVEQDLQAQEPQWVDVHIVDKPNRYLNAQLIKTSQDYILLGKDILPFLGMPVDGADTDVVHLTLKSPDDNLYIACGKSGCMMVVKLLEPLLTKVAPLVAKKQQLQSIQDELFLAVLQRLIAVSRRFCESQSDVVRSFLNEHEPIEATVMGFLDEHDIWKLNKIEQDFTVRFFMNRKYTKILLTKSPSEILSCYWSMLSNPERMALDLGLQEAMLFQDFALAKCWWHLAVKQRLLSEGRAHFNLGQVLSNEDPDAAMYHYRQAFLLEPELRMLIGSTRLLLEEE